MHHHMPPSNWVARFKRGDFSNCDAPRPGRPKTVITDQIHEVILEDRRISAKSITEQLGISRERVGSIIYEDLDMRDLSTKWAACMLMYIRCIFVYCLLFVSFYYFNPLNVQLNPICHILALLGAHHILHISRIRVNVHTVQFYYLLN